MPFTTTSWICDACRRPIRHADDGWVEWIELPVPDDAPSLIRDLRLVHSHSASPIRPGACQFDGDREYAKDGGAVADFALAEFLGADGLMHLLEMVVEQGEPSPRLFELIKRLHVPGYEHARPHFSAAIAAGIVDPTAPFGYWRQGDIRRVLAFALETKRRRNR